MNGVIEKLSGISSMLHFRVLSTAKGYVLCILPRLLQSFEQYIMNQESPIQYIGLLELIQLKLSRLRLYKMRVLKYYVENKAQLES